MESNKPPLTPTISPNTFNESFEIAILFNVDEFSGNYVLDGVKPPRAPRTRVVNYALEAYKVYIDSVVVETSKKAHSIGNSKS